MTQKNKIYQLSTTIKVRQEVYERWLDRKAKSIKRRNKEKDGKDYGLGLYKEAIHKAVCDSEGKDFYTGENLDWSLLSKFDNTEAKKGGVAYFKKFSLLPTVDHYDGRHKIDYVICSWKVNDAKNHMSYYEFVELCRKVINHSK